MNRRSFLGITLGLFASTAIPFVSAPFQGTTKRRDNYYAKLTIDDDIEIEGPPLIEYIKPEFTIGDHIFKFEPFHCTHAFTIKGAAIYCPDGTLFKKDAFYHGPIAVVNGDIFKFECKVEVGKNS